VLALAARFIAIVAVAGVVAPGASSQGTGVGFASLPKKVVQGENANVTVSVRPSGSRCTLTVRYVGGTTQPGLTPAVAANGRASWTWKVPSTVQAGAAAATVRCARAGSITRRLMIVGRLVEQKITVLKQGFSTRANSVQGTRLSYGVILHNDSTTKDALEVTVQTNFVMANNNLLGTDTQRIAGIGAGGDFALGRMVNFPGAAPIARLEVVIQVRKYQPKSLHQPTLANMHFVPQITDAHWLGSIEGEIQNTDPELLLRSATLSAVVFDANDNILGGGSGFATQSLPPGTRAALKLASGFDPIPFENAAYAMVSVNSNWEQPAP
jgi:hypothetical protein